MADDRMDSRSLHVRLKAQLLDYVRELALRGEQRLPPEEELSRLWGISRSSLRAVALSLEKEGLISRLHGKGTFIHQRALALKANIIMGQPFMTILSDLGFRASHRLLSATARPLPPEVCARLEIAADTPGLVITRLFEADGTPAVLAIDHLPVARLRTIWDGKKPTEYYRASVYEFADEHCSPTIAYSVAEILPWLATREQANLMDCVERPLMLLLEHLHYSAGDQPLVLTRAYVHPSYITFTAVRTRTEV